MKSDTRNSTDGVVSITAIRVGIRPQSVLNPKTEAANAPLPRPWPLWLRRTAFALQQTLSEMRRQHSNERRRSQAAAPERSLSNQARIATPKASIAVGPSARVIPFPQRPRRRAP